MPIKVTYPRPIGLRERWVDDSGNLLSGIHPESTGCREFSCALHNPSDHEYRHLPLVWDSLARMFVRVDEAEGEDYPDPDELAFRERMAAQGIKGPLWDSQS